MQTFHSNDPRGKAKVLVTCRALGSLRSLSAHASLPGGSEQFRLPLYCIVVATTDASHDAIPNHASPSRHKHIDRRVDMRNSRNQTRNPSPSTPMLVEHQGRKAVPRLKMPKGSCGAFAFSSLDRMHEDATRTRGRHYARTRTSDQQKSVRR